MNVRLQRKRTKGYRLPPNAVYVGRPTLWGNPYRATDADFPWCSAPGCIASGPMGAEGAVYHFRLHAAQLLPRNPSWLTPLRGHDLACWCRTDQPCHADVLLEWAA